MAEAPAPPVDSGEASILELLSLLPEYSSTIPDELVDHHLRSSGLSSPDSRITRLVAALTSKFLADISNDALQYCQMRHQHAAAAAASAGKERQPKDRRLVLTVEDLASSLKEYGVNLKRQEYFVDSESGGESGAGSLPERENDAN